LELIHVVVLDLPRMLSEVVTSILSTAPDIQVSTGLAGDRPPPDVVVVGGEVGALPDRAGELLHEFPRVRVLTVGADGRETMFYELRPHRVALGELSPDSLLEAVRTAHMAVP
jgi:hypothetical protein